MSKTYNSVKHFISTFLVLALVLSALPTTVFAAGKDPNLNNELTIALGEKRYVDGEEWDQFFTFPVTKGASQIFTVSDESVVTAGIIDSPFPEHLGQFKVLKLIGNKVGTSVVTVSETYNGKTTTIAKTIVTVADSYLTTVSYEKHEYGLGRYNDCGLSIINQKVGAEYVFTVDKEGMSVILTGAQIDCISTKLGDYKLTVTENYNGASKVLGTVDMHVLPETVLSSYTMTNGTAMSANNILFNRDHRYAYQFESDGVDINITDRGISQISFDAAVNSYNVNNPENPYPIDKCFVYQDSGGFIARLVGTQVIHVYRVDTQKMEAPALIGNVTITVLPDPTINPAIPTVPTVPAVPCKATLDGTPIVLDAYLFQENGGGANYVMLRDVAFLLNGTKAQFDVGWTAKDGIILTTNAPYASMEKVYKDYDPKPYTPNASTITIDGKPVELTAYTIEGNNYFKLRDLGAALGFGVDWDGTTGTVVINTTN